MDRRPLPCLPALLAPATAAHAQPTPPLPAETPICTDRPTRSNFACTVPKGRWQVEMDVVGWTFDHADGRRGDVLATSPTLKYGLGTATDMQLNWAPWVRQRNRAADGTVTTLAGFGDPVLRLKQRLTAADATWQVALLPFVKLPLARAGIGNGRVEGGMAMPVNWLPADGWTVTLGPQFDWIASRDGGHHPGLTGLVNIARTVGAFTLYNELWTGQNFDPAGTVRQYSYDVALAWLPRPTLQFDMGANIGLSAATPDAQLHLGVSARF